MDLVELLGSDAGRAAVGQIARQLGIDERSASSAMQAVLPAVGRGIRNNASRPGGIDQLSGALGRGHHERYVDRPELLGQSETIADGEAILGHVFGNKDVSRNVAGHAAQQTGLGADVIKKMLPMVAAVAMGMLSKQTQGGGGLGSVPSRGSQPAPGNDLFGILNQVLDADRDGSAVDDIINLAQRFF